MIEINAVLPENMPELLVAAGHPEERLIEQIKLRGGAAVTSLLGDKNEVWLGRPQAFDLLSLFAAYKKGIPPLLAAQASGSDFVALQFVCSFRPAPECEFIRATMRVRLEPSDSIAYDMFPRDVETTVTMKRTFSISPELKFKFAKVAELGVSGLQPEQSAEYIAYEPEITTFALGENAPGWDFNKTKAKPIRGSRELFLTVKKPKGISLFGRFELSATVQTNIGRIPLSTFFLSGGTKPLISEKYLIC